MLFTLFTVNETGLPARSNIEKGALGQLLAGTAKLGVSPVAFKALPNKGNGPVVTAFKNP